MRQCYAFKEPQIAWVMGSEWERSQEVNGENEWQEIKQEKCTEVRI